MKPLFLLGGLILFQMKVAQTSVYQRYLSRQSALRDVQVLSALLRTHPGMNLYEDSSAFDSFIEKQILTSLADSIEIRDFRRLLKKMVRFVHCGHTDVMFSLSYLLQFRKNNPPAIPFTATVRDTTAVITGVHKSVTNILRFGDTLLSINGQTVQEILRSNLNLFTWDGYITASAEYHAKNLFHLVTQIHFRYPEKYDIVLHRKGKTEELTLTAIVNEKNIRYKVHKSPDTLNAFGSSPKVRYYIPKAPEERWAYLKIASFTDKSFQAHLDFILRKIKKNKKDILILDLRHNGGGKILQAEYLLSRIADVKEGYFFVRKKNAGIPWENAIWAFPYRLVKCFLPLHFKKVQRGDSAIYSRNIKKRKRFSFEKIYVLVDYGTFSAASFVAYRLQRDARAVVAGEETGGTAEGCNAVIVLPCRLPESRLKVYVPLFRFCHAPGNCRKEGRGVQPDIPLKVSVSSLFKQSDPWLEFLVRKIRQEEK